MHSFIFELWFLSSLKELKNCNFLEGLLDLDKQLSFLSLGFSPGYMIVFFVSSSISILLENSRPQENLLRHHEEA